MFEWSVLVPMLVGALVTWAVARHYYVRAARELRAAANALVGMIRNCGGEPKYDGKGNLIGTIAPTRGQAASSVTADGVGADANKSDD